MKITHCTPDKLVIVPETPADMADAIDCLLGLKAGRDPEALDYLTGKKTEVVNIAPKKHLETGGGWTRVEYDTSFLRPYYEKMADLVGTPESFAVDITAEIGGIYHTHIVESAKAGDDGVLHVVGYVMVYPYIGMTYTAEQREAVAVKRHRECVNDKLGKTKHEPEFIEGGHFGCLHRNPNYMRRHEPEHAVTNDEVWQAFWRQFVFKFATAEQAGLLARLHQVSTFHTDTGPALCHLHYDKTFNIDNCGGSVKFEDFKKGHDIAIKWCPGHEPKPVPSV